MSRRVSGVAAVVAAATMTFGLISYTQTASTGKLGRDALDATRMLASVNDAQHAAAVALASAYTLVTPLDEPARTAVVDRAVEHADELRDQLAQLEQGGGDWDSEAELEEFLDTAPAVLATTETIVAKDGLLTATDVAAAQQAWDAFDVGSDTLKTKLIEVADAGERGAEAGEHRATWLIAAVGSLIVPFVLVAMWLLARSIVGPVRQTKQVLEYVAAGDFTHRLNLKNNDELGDMAHALNTTLEQVGTALASITAESEDVATASNDLREVSKHLTSGADRLSDQSTAVAASIEQTSHDVQIASTSTQQLRVAVSDIAGSAAQAAQIAAEAVGLATSANRTIAQLDASSAQISDVARVITDIADQTNLLALNATIEASRAGEAGKGFAVVAAEVKELAKRTAQATSDIGDRIGAIQSDTSAAIGELERVTDTINRIAGIQEAIAGSVKEQADATRDIEANVTRTADEASAMAGRISQVAKASLETTASAQHTEEAAERLSATAEHLQSVVGRFRFTAS